jgi:CheY-like chemotaxis protein
MEEASRSYTILVVDDDAAVLRFVALALRTEGFTVDTAVGGLAGLRQLDESQPDLILLDLAMPGIDGREFYKRARQGGFDDPVVICSAYGAKQAQLELGADGYVEKPFDAGTLMTLLRSLLGN